MIFLLSSLLESEGVEMTNRQHLGPGLVDSWFKNRRQNSRKVQNLMKRKLFGWVYLGGCYYMTFYIKGIYIKLTQYFHLLYSVVTET